jgi:hypothetical protein
VDSIEAQLGISLGGWTFAAALRAFEDKKISDWDHTTVMLAAQSSERVDPTTLNPYRKQRTRRLRKKRRREDTSVVESFYRQLANQ